MTPCNTRYRAMAAILLCGIALSGTGCNRWLELKAVEATPTAAADDSGSPSVGRVPAVITSLTVSQNGAAIAPASDIEHRVLDTLADTQLFSRLIYPGYTEAAPADPFVRAKLSVATFPEPHAGAAAWKGIVIGASMFLLAPVLPLEYDYGARMTLEVELEDGTTHRYLAAAEGTARYHLFGATHLATEELQGQVLDSCLAQLRRELVKDRQFVQGAAFAKHQPEPRTGEVAAIPAVAPMHRQTRTISILRSEPR